MRRRFLIASALVSLTVAAPSAWADREVNTEINEGISTSTATNGAADNIVITTDGRVVFTSAGTALTLDSDNDITVDGDINITSDDDGGIGVHVQGGNTGDLVINGDIFIETESEPTDNGEDEGTGFEDLDGPSAIGGNRFGVLVDGTGAFVGNIVLGDGGTLLVEGNDSAALSLQTDLDGTLDLAGTLVITGDRSTALDLRGNISGDVTITGNIAAVGEDSSAIHVDGDIAGGFYINSIISTTGYRFSSRSTNEDYLATLDDDDRFQSSSSIVLNGSIDGGILFDGVTDDERWTVTSNSNVIVRGEAPAVLISATDGDIVIGEAVQPGVPDDEDTEDTDETADAVALGFSFVNRGTISASADLNDLDATAMVFEGGDNGAGGLFTATFTHGFWNDGSITSVAYGETDASTSAHAIEIRDGAILPVFVNDGTVQATAITIAESDNFIDSYAIIIDSEAVMNSLINDGVIFANGSGGGSAYAIVDTSGTLTDITNTGVILTSHTAPSAYFDENDELIVPDDVDHETVALDLSNATDDITISQYWIRDIVEDDPETEDVDESLDALLVTEENISILGDILLGSGDDTVSVEAGYIEGALAFGDGTDLLIIDGTTVRTEIEALIAAGTIEEMTSDELYDELPYYIGAISDTDGQLSIEVDNASIELTQGGTLNIQDARFGDGSIVIFEVDAAANEPRSLAASGAVTFESGSRLSVSLSNLIGDSGAYTIISSSDLSIADGIAALTEQPTPFLYETAMTVNDGAPGEDDTIVVTLNRKSADELGMNNNQAAAYASAFAAWQSNEDLGAAIATLLTEAEFFNAYNQLLPEYTASAIQFARANNDIATGAIASRLEAVRRSPDDMGGLWIQEVGYFADREGTAFGSGYRGQGVGMSVGYDVPLGPFYVVGVNVMGSASEITVVDGVDNPMSALSVQFGAYAGAEVAGLNLDLYAGAGIDSYEYNRQILIDTFSAEPEAEWDGHHYSASARLGRDFGFGRYFLRPSVSVDYLSLHESAYEERDGGDGIDLSVSERDTTSLSASGVLAFGARFGSDNSWWAPQVRVGFREELDNDTTETIANYVGYTDSFTLVSQQLPADGLIFGFGISGGSPYSTFTLDYDGDIRDGYVRHAARLVVRLVF